MAEKKYYIPTPQGPIEVPYDVYHAYWQMARQERAQEEKERYHGTYSYDALDSNEMLGMESIPDLDSPSVEELALAKVIIDWLRRCITLLPEGERELIQALYYDGMSEREYGRQLGISQKAVNNRRRKALNALGKMMKFKKF